MTLDVYIKLTTGRVFHVAVPEDETVRELCEKVAKEEGLWDRRVRLMYDDKVLTKDHTMSHLGVRPETILKVDIMQVKELTIKVKCQNGRTITHRIGNTTSLNEIIKMTKNSEQSSFQTNDSTKLLMKGKPLLDADSLVQDHGIEDGTVLELFENVPTVPFEEVVEKLDRTRLDRLLANFADGIDKDRKVEVVFSFDTTSSMYDSITQVRSKLDSIVSRLLRDIPKIRIGIMAHGDYCDQSIYVLRSIDLTSDANKLLDFINNVPGTVGRGPIACYEWVLHKARYLSWSKRAAKALVIIGDMHPHPANATTERINWHKELEKLCRREIKVYGVQVRNMLESENFYRELAERSGGAYIKFQHFDFLTDMFLAVCYREAGEEQLQHYAEEVKQEGRMTEELTDMFQQLEEKPSSVMTQDEEERGNEDGNKKAANQGRRYQRDKWWNAELDKRWLPSYTYNSWNDEWSAINQFVMPTPTLTMRLQQSLRWDRRGNKCCSVM